MWINLFPIKFCNTIKKSFVYISVPNTNLTKKGFKCYMH